MANIFYPKEHFPGTPKLGIWVVEEGIRIAGVQPNKWQIPLEAIARYETGFNPYRHLEKPPGVCADCRGMMQQSTGQYRAHEAAFGFTFPYEDAVGSVVVAIRYIKSDLPGYGGYGNIGALLDRDDRGPGNVLRKWSEHPDWSFSELRKFYRGY